MKRLALLLCVSVLMFVASCSGSSGKVLVDVNGNKITEGNLKFLGEINPRIQSQLDNPAGLKRILENLVEQDLLHQAALKSGLNRDSKVKAKIDLYKRVIIAQSYVDAETEKAAKKYFDEHPDEFKKIKISDIMIKFATSDEIKKAKKGEVLRSEEAALKLAAETKERIDKGEEFAKIAQEVSDDSMSKARGGDLGLVSKSDQRMESRGYGPLLEKAYEMKVGEVSGPIKTDKGYHVITVTRGLELEPFEQAKQAILFKVGNDTRQNLLAKLKKDSKITYPEEEKAKAEAKKKAEEQAKTEAAKPAGETKPAEEAKPAEMGASPTEKPAEVAKPEKK